MKKVRVRYAPSPTGLLHIGNARSALFNYLFARHHGGDFIIRIEDTDVARNVEGGEESQLTNLKWLGLDWNESPDKGGNYGPYRQLERLELYTKYANELLEKGLAYKEYREDSDKFAIRFKVPENVTYQFDDMVRGTLKFESKEIEDWIIMKDNGIPTYNFAVVVDDHLMEISHVLRGEEHITNTPKQIMVYNAFGWETPVFGHMTIIVNENKKKLSKRDKNVIQFISEYANLGYLPEAMFNFISLLGFSPKGEEEILTQEEIIALFDDKRLSKAPAMFDKEKLAYVNSRYIKKLEVSKLAELARPYLEKENIVIESQEWLETLVGLLQDRLTYIAEIVSLYKAFFHENFVINEEEKQFLVENNSKELLVSMLNAFEAIEFDAPTIEQTIKQVGKDTGIKGKLLFMPARIATTGEMHGPSLPVSLALLGKERIISRIKETIKQL
ncbi:Glutamyl-tRNA synthetase [Alteracholeplasma palmae J233]|uniref:Glutamate--tRNA ligase n=1 Tax=Alteracholeplasma palmae (strain ATCC 49389 / J233) TaxID=1318466 RepID=U4KLR8_ALTPJ|nr:glutamate--tRNA ligase [Alteracholeplasma palmae]CCV64867.1 Glutamyl-tRNA synthetase [Alteracholeplasma palmae J233]